MKATPAILAAAITAGLAAPATAHSPFPGVGDFYNGMLHPVVVPAYLLAVLGLGLLFGQHAPRSSRLAVPAFAIALVAALATPPLTAEPLPQSILLGLVLVAGLLVAFSIDVGTRVPCLVGTAAGILIGFDTRQNALVDRQSWLALVGAALGTILAVALFGGVITWLRRSWRGIAVRVLGSWTAASAFLVIALSLAPKGAEG